MADDNKNIFQKIMDAGDIWLDNQIQKAKNQIATKTVKEEEEAEPLYGKAVTLDNIYRINSNGYRDRTGRLNSGALKSMSVRDSIVASIIQTRQNQVAKHSALSQNERDSGFKIVLKNEEAALEAVKLTMKVENGNASEEDKERLKELGVNVDKIEVKNPEEQMTPEQMTAGMDPEGKAAKEQEQKEAQEEMQAKQFEMQEKQMNHNMDMQSKQLDIQEDAVKNGQVQMPAPQVPGMGGGGGDPQQQQQQEKKFGKSYELLRKAPGGGDAINEELEDNDNVAVSDGDPGSPDGPAPEEGNGNGGENGEVTGEYDPNEGPGDDNDPEAPPAMEEQESMDDAEEKNDFEMERQARCRLEKEIDKRRQDLEQFLLNCGEVEDRDFESKRWNFDSFLRAIVRDTLTYDFITTEVVRDQADRPHHFFPVDAATIRFAAPSLKNWKDLPNAQIGLDITYPEKQIEYLEENTDALELDEEKLEDDEYKYVQVIRGNIERAFTQKELKVGIRNATTDIYANGYGISELELLVTLVTSHLNTEYYNQSYFTQGFSAKGILHLKAPLNRRKLETIRIQWQHMLKGARNSFQTPIFAGMDDVQWIPLTQNHSDIEFQGWMNYLIKLICAIYQIDPTEIGYGMNEEGGSGGGLSGDNTAEKVNMSLDKGLLPLMRFIENYINTKIVDLVDPDFKIVFTGMAGESGDELLTRLEREGKIAKTVNEIRDELGLKPLPGMDDFINEPTYMQWYTAFSEKGQQQMDKQMAADSAAAGPPGGGDGGPGGGDEGGGDDDFTSNPDYDQEFDGAMEPPEPGGGGGFGKSLKKSVKPLRVEVYKL